MHILILAGGFGTRLRTVVSDVPKPMAPIENKPFLEYQIQEIRKYFPNTKIYLLTYYLSDIIEKYFINDKSIVIIKEDNPLGTGGSIKNAINFLNLERDSTLLIFNGDTYIKPNLSQVVNKNNIVIVGSFQKTCNRYGTLKINEDKIIDFLEKDKYIKNSYINAGCYFFNNLDFFNKVNDDEFNIESKFKNHLLNNSIDIFKYNGIFIDIGIPEDYKKIIKYIKRTRNDID